MKGGRHIAGCRRAGGRNERDADVAAGRREQRWRCRLREVGAVMQETPEIPMLATGSSPEAVWAELRARRG